MDGASLPHRLSLADDPLGPDETNERLLEKYAMYANLDEE